MLMPVRAANDARVGSIPGFKLYWYTPIPRVSPASEAANINGSTLGDFRTVLTGYAGAYTWLVIKDGTALGLVSGDYSASPNPVDGIHLAASGDTKLKTNIKTDTGY